MKKRIFIAMHYMEIGGAEISLIGLLNAIDYTKYDVDLFISSHQGEMMKLIPNEVNLLPEDSTYAAIRKPMGTILKQGHLLMFMARLWARYRFTRYARTQSAGVGYAYFQYIAKATGPLLKSLNYLGEYDFAISFLDPHNIVRDKVLARKKLAWIHTDYSTIHVDKQLELPVWASFDYIASISPDVSKAFCQVFPSLEKKIILIENILSPDFVRKRAGMDTDLWGMASSKGELRLLSVGRYSSAKNFENIPFIARQLRKLGLSFKWCIIGYGGDEELIKSKIAEAGMEKHVILLGKKTNPYPYMAQCDFYIQPSRYEGKSVTVREAQMLYKPVIVTNYPTASSQIRHGVDGYIVPLDNESCAHGIYDFIQNKALQQEIIAHLHQSDYGNESAVLELYKLID